MPAPAALAKRLLARLALGPERGAGPRARLLRGTVEAAYPEAVMPPNIQRRGTERYSNAGERTVERQRATPRTCFCDRNDVSLAWITCIALALGASFSWGAGPP
jgi:hypothetical protein